MPHTEREGWGRCCPSGGAGHGMGWHGWSCSLFGGCGAAPATVHTPGGHVPPDLQAGLEGCNCRVEPGLRRAFPSAWGLCSGMCSRCVGAVLRVFGGSAGRRGYWVGCSHPKFRHSLPVANLPVSPLSAPSIAPMHRECSPKCGPAAQSTASVY